MWVSTAANTANRLTRTRPAKCAPPPCPSTTSTAPSPSSKNSLVAALTTSVPEEEIVALRAQADRELAPYRAKMQAVQLKQVQQQFLLKRLLESRQLPRLSLFYMAHA